MEEIHYGYGMPPDFSSHGAGIDNLIHVVHIFMIALFVGWGIFFIITLIKFRQRDGHRASYESAASKLPKVLEVAIVLFEAFLLIGLSFPIWNYYKKEPPPADKALTVRIVAQQFVWNIHYPGEDGKFGRTDIKLIDDSNPLGVDPNDPASADDFFTMNQFNFPVNKPIIAQITSKDVIHSFGVPVLRIKQDAVPGQVVPVWFTAVKTGHFDIHCSQLCGVGHSLMKGTITVQNPEDFKKWVDEQPRPWKKETPQPKQAKTPQTTEAQKG
jgi:cytochrome c oxidase subunit II